MVRLIVVDSGGRRAFQVGEGRLSVGSGSEAQLRLQAAGVAVLHADIEVQDGKARLHPRPGVLAPQLFGRAVSASVALQHGVPVQLGGATLAVEYDELQSIPISDLSAPPGSLGPLERRALERAEPALVPGEAGLPTWAWIAIGIPLLCATGWFVMHLALGAKTSQIVAADAEQGLRDAGLHFRQGRFSEATEQLDRIGAVLARDDALAAQAARLRADIAEQSALSAEQIRNRTAGRQYFDSQLQGFAERYMKDPIASPQARVFLRRARYFREQWPAHPQLEWVAREEARLAAALDLRGPPSFDDVKFEVESLTWSEPRDYREAFAVLHAFAAAREGRELEQVQVELRELERRRAEWFKLRLEQAGHQLERNQTGEACGVLLSILRFAGDVGMEDEAAARLLSVGDMENWLSVFARHNPVEFESIAKNRVIAAFLEKSKR